MGSPLDLIPKKSFGQNFLVQRGAIDLILHASLATGAKRILEVGPGPGTLTRGLLQDGRPVWGIELDPDACAYLSDQVGSRENFHLIRGDAVTAELPIGDPWSVVGNLPYNAATAILTRFLVEPIPWDRMVLMFQLEVGQKLMGKPGEKAYGPLSILAQLTTRMTRLMKLGPGAFMPSPKVDSVVLLFEPRPDAPDHARRQALLKLLHRSFAHRRKTLSNNWQSWLKAEDISALLEREKLPPAIRAEAIEPRAWLSILEGVEALHASTHDSDETPL